MAELKLHRETVRTGLPVRVGPVTLLSIERVTLIGSDDGRVQGWLAAAMEPYALIVHDAGGTRAFGRDAKALPLETLRDRVPGLDALLASMQATPE